MPISSEQNKIALADIESALKAMRQTEESDVSLNEIMKLAEVMASSFGTFFKSLDVSIYRELGDISATIRDMKADLQRVRPEELRQNRIPSAGHELDAIVSATEEATNQILESAESLMAADPSDTDAYQNAVNDHAMQLFEACSFQDITGQRISKVVETLQIIDERISRLTGILDEAGLESAEQVDEQTLLSEEHAAREQRKKDLILHGPQLAGDGVDQTDVDALLNDMSFDSITPADETDATGDANDMIDKLFD